MENQRQSNRNEWLDAIKLFASFMVVFIHVRFFGKAGELVNAAARFAVPLFFAISGFFAVKTDIKTIKRRLIKILILYITATIVYHLINIIISVANNGSSGFEIYFKKIFAGGGYWKFFVLNLPFSSVHLWYLLSLIYVYLIWMVIVKFSINDKVIFILATCLLIANLVLGEGLSIFGITIASEYVRNFALMGFPFFTFGYLIGKNQDRIKRIKVRWLVILAVLGTTEAVLSRYFLQSNELYVGSIAVCFSLLVIALKLSERKVNGFVRYISKTSTDIYVYHLAIPLCGSVFLGGSSESVVTNSLSVNLWPIAVCLLSIVFSIIKSLIVSKIKNLKQKKSR